MKYRRLWLALLVLVFAVTAPAVIFWTSGYRWNAKKGVVERNGTLIVDTEPAGVRVILNGEVLEERTPFTRQDIAPGAYHIRMEREGYHPWEKTLEVRPERVTFVTDVWLWRDTQPVLFRDAPILGIAGSADGREIAVVEVVAGTPRLTILPVGGGVFTGSDATRTFQGRAPTGTVHLTWNEAGTGVLIEDAAEGIWVAGTAEPVGVATTLPSGVYRWSEETLVGTVGRERFTYALGDGAVRRVALSEGIVDEEDDFQVMTDASGFSIVERGRETRRFALPTGLWTFEGQEEGWLLLRSESPSRRWLAFDPRANEEGLAAVNLPADVRPQTVRFGRESLFLTFGGNELWFVSLGTPAQLLARTSEVVIGAVWHPRAAGAFYATTREVIALDLDARDGHIQTTLAAFERLSGLAIANRVLYIAGEREGVQGLWTVAVE